MKTYPLLVIAASVCLLAVLISSPAVSQDTDSLENIQDDFCEEVKVTANEANDELCEAKLDLTECIEEYPLCIDRAIETQAECLEEAYQCAGLATDDAQDSCDEAGLEFKDTYEDALRRADRNDVEDEFLAWLGTEEGKACVQPAVDTFNVCAGTEESDCGGDSEGQ